VWRERWAAGMAEVMLWLCGHNPSAGDAHGEQATQYENVSGICAAQIAQIHASIPANVGALGHQSSMVGT